MARGNAGVDGSPPSRGPAHGPHSHPVTPAPAPGSRFFFALAESDLAPTVVPAQAGTHVSPDTRCHRSSRETWMPASAGMTSGRETSCQPRHHSTSSRFFFMQPAETPPASNPLPVVPALRLPARAGAQDKLQPEAESWDPCLTWRVSPDGRRHRSSHRQARRVEPPAARAVDPHGAPHAVGRGAERK